MSLLPLRKDYKILKSEIDDSVNFVKELGPGQALEARYVRRHPDYVACYLSTQTGCAQSCRMCHLTATGQNKPWDATHDDLLEQARYVLDHYYATQPGAHTVHYNFMARGEPLASDRFLGDAEEILLDLGRLADEYGLVSRFLVSTIMPERLPASLVQLFPVVHPEFYYSLYSMRPEFRKRWLPRAIDPEKALDLLTEWQRHTKKVVRIHHALIEGENDDLGEVRHIAHAIRDRNLRADFTLVRYNPPTERHGREPDDQTYQRYARELQLGLPFSRIKVIDRVGHDVYASCGMFVNPGAEE